MIVKLDKSTCYFIPELVRFYDEEIRKMSPLYSDGVDDLINERQSDYFENIANGGSFDLEGQVAPAFLNMFLDEENKIGGIIDYYLYRDIGPDDFDVNIFYIDFVVAKEKGNGIGTALITDLVGKARTKYSPSMIGLTVKEANKDAIRLYERIGFNLHSRHPLVRDSLMYSMKLY